MAVVFVPSSQGDVTTYLFSPLQGRARSKASELGIEFTGLLGLLKVMKKSNVISPEEIDDVVKLLKKSNMREDDIKILKRAKTKQKKQSLHLGIVVMNLIRLYA